MPLSNSKPAPGGLLVVNLLAQISYGLLAMTICLPSMQEWGHIFARDQAAVQLTFSAFVVAFGALQLLYGPLSDRYGRKGILMVGLCLAGLGSVLAALSTSLELLTLSRTLQGAGSAAGMVTSRSAVQDLFQGPQRTRVMAYIGMTLGLCPPAATLIGGQIHVHWGWQANFMVMAVLSVALFLAAWLGFPASKKVPVAGSHWFGEMVKAYAVLARERTFGLYVVVLAMTTATFYVFLAGAPIVLGSYGVGPDRVGWYIMAVPVAYIVGNFLTSKWIARVGERRMMVLGQSAAMAGLAVMLVLGLAQWKTPLAFALPLLLLGMGHGFLNPPALAGTVGVVPALAGSAAAVAGLIQQLMGAAGGYAVGLVTHDGAVNLGLLMGASTLCAGGALMLLQRLPATR